MLGGAEEVFGGVNRVSGGFWRSLEDLRCVWTCLEVLGGFRCLEELRGVLIYRNAQFLL